MFTEKGWSEPGSEMLIRSPPQSGLTLELDASHRTPSLTTLLFLIRW
jgi:hypothetical protein